MVPERAERVQRNANQRTAKRTAPTDARIASEEFGIPMNEFEVARASKTALAAIEKNGGSIKLLVVDAPAEA